MQQAATLSFVPFETVPHCSPLDILEAEQRAVSDAVLVLERRRQALLLQSGADAEIACIDQHIAHYSHRLDQLGELEQALANSHSQNRITL